MVQRLLSLVLVGMLAVMGLSAIPAQAQGGLDATQPPSFGVVDIESGFMPDPHEAAVIGGGPIDVNAELGEVCQGAANGFAASAPDYRLNYTAGEYLLRLFFVGDADSAMVINGPDGMWYCHEDGGWLRLEAPSITIGTSGRIDAEGRGYGGGAGIRMERASVPAAMRQDIERWIEQYPRVARFIEDLYASERNEE